MNRRKIYYLIPFLVFAFFVGINNAIAAVNMNSLVSLKTKNTEVSSGDKLYFNLKLNDKYTYSDSTKIIVYFGMGEEDIEVTSRNVFDVLKENPYVLIDSSFSQGKSYHISRVMVRDNNNGTKWYVAKEGGTDPSGNKGIYLESLKNTEFTVKLRNYITEFELTSSKEVKLGEGEMTFKFDAYKRPDDIKVVLQNKNVTSSNITVPLELGDNDEAKLDLTKIDTMALFPGEYYISKIYLEQDNPDEYVEYNLYGGNSISNQYASILPKTIDFTILQTSDVWYPKNDTEANSILNEITILTDVVDINGKVDVYIDTKKSLISAVLTFTSDKESMIVNVKDLNTNKAYFIAPFTTEAGTYELDYAVLKDASGKEYHYRKGEDYYNIKHFDFKSKVVVTDGIAEGALFSLDNDKIDDNVIKKIKKLQDNIVIEINAEANPIIREDLFKAISGSNKTIVIKYKDIEWTFNGLDIKEPKQINVSTSLYDLKEDDTLASNKYYKGFILDFADNKKLPGKCLIKVYNSELMAKIMNKENANIYYLNEETGKYDVIKLGSEYSTDGYYEFYIEHNSKYLITKDKIDSKYVSNVRTNINDVENGKLNSILAIGVPAAIVTIVLFGIIIFLINDRKRLKKQVDSTKK